MSPAGRVEGFKSVSSKLAETRSGPARPQGRRARQRDDQARLRRGRVVFRRDRRLRRHEPAGHRQGARSPSRRAEVKYSGYVAAQESAFVKALKAKVPKAVVGQSFRTVYGGIVRQDPGQRGQGHPRHRRRRRRPGRPAAPARHRLEPELPRRQRRLLAARRRHEGRPGRHLRRPGHRRLARASLVRRPGRPRRRRRRGRTAPPGPATSATTR